MKRISYDRSAIFKKWVVIKSYEWGTTKTYFKHFLEALHYFFKKGGG